MTNDSTSPLDAESDCEALSRRLGEACLALGVRLTTAESCTGGGVASAITAIAGSSAYFETGYVTYANAAKQRLLGVSRATLEAHGAVSEETVREMVIGACRDSGAELGVAVSGVAGPAGGSPDKPVGTVWFAWGNQHHQRVQRHHLPGDRRRVRELAVAVALSGLIESLAKSRPGRAPLQ
ncbi:CinA family protein [Salinicola corii]|uniref:CinA family protein n=1 Tax=Salinicola corii TaxID=2606937 RepID=A0A640WI14_9GAMM|nr:CinA family protein [Salinicola corii]KAA0019949.1 CinA family protein [Salinicola corii]